MAVLLTGGTGKTSRVIVKHLAKSNTPFLVTSRRGASGAPEASLEKNMVKFDYTDEASFQAPFEREKIKALYIVMPDAEDPVTAVSKFVDLAQSKGVTRYVLLGAAGGQKGGPGFGKIWEKLDNLGVEYTVILPTWFTDNLVDDAGAIRMYIRRDDKIYTSSKGNLIPFVAAKDIGEVAYHALTDSKPVPQELYLMGPELLNYAQVAEKVSKALGRKITHEEVDQETRAKQYEENGRDAAWSQILASLEWRGGSGPNDVVEKICGRKGTSMDEWLAEYGEQIG